MSPELVSDIARVAHEKLLSILTECGMRRRQALAFCKLSCVLFSKTKGLDAVVRGVTVQMMAVYL